jgi:hypothetical protein
MTRLGCGQRLAVRRAHAIRSGVMTAAIFGLVGVIVGGLINAAVAAWQARQADKASARTGARLVALELGGAAAVLMLNPHQEGRRQFSDAAWRAYRDALARTLSDEDWDVLTQAYEVIEGSDAHVIARAIAPKADPKAPGSPTRSDYDLVLDAYSRMQRIGLPSRRRAWRGRGEGQAF